MRADADRAGSPGNETPPNTNACTPRALKRLMGQAIHTHQMIRDGDHVLVGVSGGKDSMSLLWLLRDRIRRVPKKYRLTAVHVDPGFGADSAGQMERFFTANGFDYRLFRSNIGPRAHSAANRENPCFLCSRLRRKILFDLAQGAGLRAHRPRPSQGRCHRDLFHQRLLRRIRQHHASGSEPFRREGEDREAPLYGR